MLRTCLWLLGGFLIAAVMASFVVRGPDLTAARDALDAAPPASFSSQGNNAARQIGAPGRSVLESPVDARVGELRAPAGVGNAPVNDLDEPSALAAAEAQQDEALPVPPVVEPILGTGLVQSRIGQRQLRGLVDSGFAVDRAEWIIRRYEELRMQTLEARYGAERSGRPVDLDEIAAQVRLRKELGDDEYERYLRALGRPTDVPVLDVLATSPAAAAGMQPGDRIIAYAGTRVFDRRGFDALTRDGNPGELVVIDVQRDGALLQLVVPRGPLGAIGGGPAARRPGTGRTGRGSR